MALTPEPTLAQRLADYRTSAAIDDVVALRRKAGRRSNTPEQRALYLARCRGMVEAIATVTGEGRTAIAEEVESRYTS